MRHSLDEWHRHHDEGWDKKRKIKQKKKREEKLCQVQLFFSHLFGLHKHCECVVRQWWNPQFAVLNSLINKTLFSLDVWWMSQKHFQKFLSISAHTSKSDYTQKSTKWYRVIHCYLCFRFRLIINYNLVVKTWIPSAIRLNFVVIILALSFPPRYSQFLNFTKVSCCQRSSTYLYWLNFQHH